MPEIIVKLGTNVVQKYFFVNEPMRIGRAPENEIVIENLAISRSHAVIRHEEGRHILMDLDSSNGTFINDVRIKKAEIMDKDVIAIGKHRLYFYDQNSAERSFKPSFLDTDRTMMLDSPPAEPKAEILVTKGRQKGLHLTLTQTQTTIGRGSASDFRLTDWFVSKTHAVIERRDAHFFVRDLGSWRHTLVNRVMVEEAPLADGDAIQLGPTVELTFSLKPAESAVPIRPSLRVPLELDAEGLAKAPQPTPCLEEGDLAAPESKPNLTADEAPQPPAEPAAPEPALPEPALPLGPVDMVPPAQRADSLITEIAVASLQAAASSTTNGQTHSTPSDGLLDPWSLAESEPADYTDPESGPCAGFEWPPCAGDQSAQPQPVSSAAACESGPPASARREEIEVWEQALRNRSALIRKQAARRLKQLTGKDYEY